MASELTEQLERLLSEGAERKASDLFLIPGEPPVFRVRGELERTEAEPLTAEDVRQIAHKAIGADKAERIGTELGDVVTTCSVPGVAEGRMCIAKANGQLTIVIRFFISSIPSVEVMRLPKGLLSAAESPNGLIVTAGLNGSGKTTSAFALLEHLNTTRYIHIRTVENPSCVRLEPKRAIIQQQSVGIDTPDILNGIRTAMMQDLDVLLVGEITSVGVLDACIAAAETGHLVITQIHAASPEAAIQRMIDVQPADLQPVFRRSLAGVLRAVSVQRLLPLAEGKGRTVAYGLLVPDKPMRQAIAEGRDPLDRKEPLPQGCQSLADDIRALQADGKVTQQAATDALSVIEPA